MPATNESSRSGAVRGVLPVGDRPSRIEVDDDRHKCARQFAECDGTGSSLRVALVAQHHAAQRRMRCARREHRAHPVHASPHPVEPRAVVMVGDSADSIADRPAVVDIRYRPDHGPCQRRRLSVGEPVSAGRRRTRRTRRRRRHRRGPHPRRLPRLAGRHRRTGGRRRADRRGQRRAVPGRRADGPFHDARGCRAAVARLPGAGRGGEPAAAARVPLRHVVDDRLRLLTAGDHPELGRPRAGVAARMPRARPSRCCTTARSTSPETPAMSRRCAGPSRTPAAGLCPCSARRCAPRTPSYWSCSAPPTRW